MNSESRDNQSANNSYFFPMLVSTEQGKKDSSEVVIQRWRDFEQLPEQSQRILTSQQLTTVIKDVSTHYSLSIQHIDQFSRLIRMLYFGALTPQECIDNIQNLLGTQASESTDIYNSIVSIEPEEDEVKEDEIDTVNSDDADDYSSLPLRQAAKEFPAIGEQLLSDEMLKLTDGREVRPSVANWVRLYRSELGVDRHGTMERGNFLFHSENTLHLDSSERRRLATVLKSLDEDTSLLIDPELQEIVFVDRITTSDQHSVVGEESALTAQQHNSETTQHPPAGQVEDSEASVEQEPIVKQSLDDHTEASGREKLERMVTQATLDDAGVRDWKPEDIQDGQQFSSESAVLQEVHVPVVPESKEVPADSTSADKESVVETNSEDTEEKVSEEQRPLNQIAPPVESDEPLPPVFTSPLESKRVPLEARVSVPKEDRSGSTPPMQPTATVRKSWSDSHVQSIDTSQDYTSPDQEAEPTDDAKSPTHPVSWERESGITEMPKEPVFSGRRFDQTTKEQEVLEVEEDKTPLRASNGYENAFGVSAPIPRQELAQTKKTTENVPQNGAVENNDAFVNELPQRDPTMDTEEDTSDQKVSVTIESTSDHQEEEVEEDREHHEHQPDQEQEELQYHMASIRPYSSRPRMNARLSRHSHQHSNVSQTLEPDIFADETERFRARVVRGENRIGLSNDFDTKSSGNNEENVSDMRFSSNQVFPSENDVDTVESVVNTTTGEHNPSPNTVRLEQEHTPTKD